MAKRLRRITAALLMLLLFGSASKAADTVLVLKARVIDENGLPVGGAQVKLEQAGGRVFSAVGDDRGYFSLPNLSPGEYTIRVEKQGYFVLADQKIQLAAESTEFAFTLNHEEEVREKVDVTVSENRIDPATTQSTESLSSTEIRDIPVASSHTLQQSLVAMPQVVQDNLDLIHIAGARNTQAQYLLDGVEVGDPASNGLNVRMIVEAVRSAEIQTGRFGAEYAHPGAAVLSYETREGDDKWRFGTTDFIPGISTQNGLQLGSFYPRVVFSGPIVREQLWFSQSFDVLHTINIEKDLPSNANETQQWGGDSWSRLLWKMSTNSSLHINFLSNVEDDSNLGLDALHPQPTTIDATMNRLFGSVKEQSYWEKTLFEFGVGVERTHYEANPQGAAPYVLLVNGAEGNYFQGFGQDSARYQLFSDAISEPLKWFGTHTISGGGNLSSVDVTQAATRGEIQALRSDQTLDRLTTFAGSADFRVANTLAGGFVQDSWSPSKHVVVQSGVRADWDRLFHAALAQPRVALNWMPWADDRGKFSIGWGMYDIPLNLTVIGQAYDQQQVDTLYDPTGTLAVQGPATSRFVLPPGGLQQLQQPYFDIASAGWQQRIGKNTLVSVELLARDQHHGLVWETLSPGQIGSEFLLESSRRDKYRSATVMARHTFANSTVVFGSYTRSQASSDQLLDPTLGALYFAAQQAGALSWDAPNRVLSWASVPTPIWGILFTYLFDYRTGYPYSNINQQQFLVGAANAQRFPDYASLTIGLEKKFGFSHRVFAVRVAVINILNRQNPDVVYNNVDSPNFGVFAGGQGRAFTARLRFVGKR